MEWINPTSCALFYACISFYCWNSVREVGIARPAEVLKTRKVPRHGVDRRFLLRCRGAVWYLRIHTGIALGRSAGCWIARLPLAACLLCASVLLLLLTAGIGKSDVIQTYDRRRPHLPSGLKVPTGAQAVELKKASQEGKLTKEKIEQAVAPTKREETPPLKITLMEEDLRPYFPDKRTTIPDVKRGVLEALDLRKKALERQKAKAQADKDGKKKPEPSR